MNTYFVTTPIYYVNDLPHIGHTYTTIAADILARWKRLCGEPVLFLTGTDEHGLKISQAAAAKGMPEQTFVDEYAGAFQSLWDRLDISYDRFIRTTDPDHVKVVQAFFQRLQDAGHIYKGMYRGLYCVPDETYFASAQVVDNACPECGRPLKEVEEESYFFRLSAYGEFLLAWYRHHPEFLQPPERSSEIINFVAQGLKDLSVSRVKVRWGIPVPNDPQHTIYVWFDALLNYLTGAGYGSDEQRFTHTWPAAIHFVGKEIFKFHAVIWPAMLHAAGFALPHTVYAHGWWTHDGQKMSKSLGNVIHPTALTDRFGMDSLRYFLFREIPFGADGDFSETAFLRRYNHDLANDFGNLASRIFTMLSTYMPNGFSNTAVRLDADASFDMPRILEQIVDGYDRARFDQAISALWKIVLYANQYIERERPWVLAKTNDPHLVCVLERLTAVLMVIAVFVFPIMPQSAQKLWSACGVIETPAEALGRIRRTREISLPARRTPFEKIPPLFPRAV